ncbi:MAG: DUF523 domain-containing protein [Bacilli bacterium]|nr:DUF523 domain-containing protein [Bacilli bacterium]
MSKANIAISACLLGHNCRYDGKAKYYPKVELLKDKYNLIPICPEVLGGLPTPRVASEIVSNKVLREDGLDNTLYFNEGAKRALAIYKENNCIFAILKESSPSCGSNLVHDGSFSGKKIKGIGFTARQFMQEGITIYTEEDIDMLLEEDKNE